MRNYFSAVQRTILISCMIISLLRFSTWEYPEPKYSGSCECLKSTDFYSKFHLSYHSLILISYLHFFNYFFSRKKSNIRTQGIKLDPIHSQNILLVFGNHLTCISILLGVLNESLLSLSQSEMLNSIHWYNIYTLVNI